MHVDCLDVGVVAVMTRDEVRAWRDRCRDIVNEKGLNSMEKTNNGLIALVLDAVLQED